jgi:hypothetical protein
MTNEAGEIMIELQQELDSRKIQDLWATLST